MRIITGFVSLSLQCFEDIGFSLAVPYSPAMLVYPSLQLQSKPVPAVPYHRALVPPTPQCQLCRDPGYVRKICVRICVPL